jgi:uncharacterized protein (TIGR03118 family)
MRGLATRPRIVLAATAALIGTLVAVPAATAREGTDNRFRQTNLVSDVSNQGALVVDANLKNPWGLALGPTSPLWVADNQPGVATIYKIGPGGTSVTVAPLVVTLPGGRTSTGDGPSPTGQVFNPTSGFGGAKFIFSSESGQITAWTPTDGYTAELKFSSDTAVYKGLALAAGPKGPHLYAANFHDATVDVFNTNFDKVPSPGGFKDPSLPAGYAPFGIEHIRGLIYVTYALQKQPDMHDDMSGPGHGFIDIFTPQGFLVKRLVSGGALNSPWGLALAPEDFGPFGGKLLVGNFGDGHINVFQPLSGRLIGQLNDEKGNPVTIEGLWGLHFGTDATAGEETLLFSAGINEEKDGLLGSITSLRG